MVCGNCPPQLPGASSVDTISRAKQQRLLVLQQQPLPQQGDTFG